MHLKKILTAILAALAIQSQAIDFISTNLYSVAENQTVTNEAWVFAAIAETEGIFKNDLFIASGNPLDLGGIFEGNVWALGLVEANFTGSCERNMRLFSGMTVRIDGPVNGNIIASANTVSIGTNAVISGDVRLVGGSIVVEGVIKGNADISAARLTTFGGRIEGNTSVNSPELLLSRGTAFAGDLSYISNNELIPDEGVISGTLTRKTPSRPQTFSKARFYSHISWFFAALLAGIPFITLFPMTTAIAAQLARKAAFKCLLVGFVALIAIPMFGLMAMSSIVGIPLGTLVIGSWAILLYVSRFISAIVLGTLLLRSFRSSFLHILIAMGLGLAVIYLATFFPVIGEYTRILVLCTGMGALLLALVEKRRLILQVPQNLEKLEALQKQQKQTEEK